MREVQHGRSVYGDQAMGRVISGLIADWGQEMSVFQKRSWLALGCTRLPIYWVMGGGVFLSVG